MPASQWANELFGTNQTIVVYHFNSKWPLQPSGVDHIMSAGVAGH